MTLPVQIRLRGAGKSDRLSIFQVMPRGMNFGACRATPIDLCIRDLVAYSWFRGATRIFAEDAEDHFSGFALDDLPKTKLFKTFRRANHVAAAARLVKPDVIIVQQHLPTAAAIAVRLPGTKVVLHTHNFQKSYARNGALKSSLRRKARLQRYASLAGVIHVSRACQSALSASWPELMMPQCIVNNGLDFTEWQPASERAKEVLYVGRCAPEKGVVEAARAMAAALPDFPDWRARFILSAVDIHPACYRDVVNALASLGTQVTIETQQPFARVKSACEHAAIAIVPSKCAESFGRTALEAHAGGAALISSGTGGLREISGGAAEFLSEVTPETIQMAVANLIAHPVWRAQLAYDGCKHVRQHFDIRTQAANLDAFCMRIADNTARRRNADASNGTGAPLAAAE